MRRKAVLAAGVALGILCLVLAGMQAGSPLLYSPASDARARDHVNPFALRTAAQDKSSRIVPLVADIIQTPGSLVLNIKLKDFASASQDLQEYRNSLKNLDTLVINLDMTESELAEFKRAGQENYRILAELLNGTERWDELQTLEVRFQESGDTGMMTSIKYEGETLKRKMQDLYREYLEQDDVILSTGEKFEIDTAGYEGSTVDFREIVNGISREQEKKNVEIAGPDILTISLVVSPGRVSYGDTVRMEGRLEDAAGGSPGEVVLFVDSAKKVTLSPGPDGYFSYGHLVERDRAGTHTVFAVCDGHTSLPSSRSWSIPFHLSCC